MCRVVSDRKKITQGISFCLIPVHYGQAEKRFNSKNDVLCVLRLQSLSKCPSCPFAEKYFFTNYRIVLHRQRVRTVNILYIYLRTNNKYVSFFFMGRKWTWWTFGQALFNSVYIAFVFDFNLKYQKKSCPYWTEIRQGRFWDAIAYCSCVAPPAVSLLLGLMISTDSFFAFAGRVHRNFTSLVSMVVREHES